MDEFGQTQAALFHAAGLRTTYARADRFNLNVAEYAQPRQIYGRMTFLALTGDHLQLPPVPKSSSMLASLDGTSDEHKAGAAMFSNIEYVYEMETMMRFRDHILISILTKMRKLGGGQLADEEWDALRATELDPAEVERDPAAFLARTEGWIESCYLWSVTSTIAFTRAKASAMCQQKLLYYCLSSDQSDQLGPAELKRYSERMLQVPSISETDKLPGVVALHVGMRMRLTKAIESLRPFALPDAVGTVVKIDLQDEDRAALVRLHQEGDASQLAAHAMVLRSLPRVWLKLDDVAIEFLPPVACLAHTVSGFARDCLHCESFPGVVEVSPCTGKWYFKEPADGISVAVVRTQLPLLPEGACSLYTLQGGTADPGMIAHFAMPQRADPALRWLIVYVLLSRVRGLNTLVSLGITVQIREVVEAGPPEEVVANFERLFRSKIITTKRIAKESRVALGWPPVV